MWRSRLPLMLAGLWWGSLSTVGFWVVPMLFAHLATPAVAGAMAAKLFAAQTWVGLGCGLLLLMLSRPRGETTLATWAKANLGLVLAAMLLALLSEFAVAPRIVARDNLALWHGVGTGLYALQWLLTAAVFWRLAGPSQRTD
ncbi:DUF4149 domain-containing protein [Curvibacter sp. HBC28]|uniref:DUF4149 domain-containing protein n=1 Tax=Curvibacter microcysteis TaxID=3026419 RepID=A0ABT5MG40_9BURK|nr:DUF4149 domain-containing protein [Curvibacter sp. HBC28]MDD0814140.1 DUF4149 domain-containing protein [Curvibacter sp. HBC28]